MIAKTTSFSLTVALMALSGMAQATSAWHQGNGDVVHITPEHIGQNTAMRTLDPKVHDQMLHGDSVAPQMGQKFDVATAGSKTRQQVVQELLSQSINEREQMKKLYAN